MGLAMGRLLGLSYRLTKQLQARILILGLDAAGKTTRLKTGELATYTTSATVAFSIETIEYKSIRFTFWDVGGSAPNRPLWKYYFRDTQGLIFVVDSSDRDRIRLARDELSTLVDEEEELGDAALLVLANKQDLPNAMTAAEMAQELGLHRSLGTFRALVQPQDKASTRGWIGSVPTSMQKSDEQIDESQRMQLDNWIGVSLFDLCTVIRWCTTQTPQGLWSCLIELHAS